MEKIERGTVSKKSFDDLHRGAAERGRFSLPRIRGATGKFRLFGHYVHAQFLLLALSELLVIFVVGLSIESYLLASTPAVGEYSVLWMGARIALMAVVFVLFMAAVGLYDTRQRERLSGLVVRLIAALLLGSVALTFLYTLLPSFSVSNDLLKITALTSVLSLAVMRALFYKFIDGQVLLRRVLVVGAGRKARLINKLRRKSDTRGFHLVGFVELNTTDSSPMLDNRVIQLDGSLCDYSQENDIDEIVLALDEQCQSIPARDLLDCRKHGVDVTEILDFFERESALIQLDLVQPSWLVHTGSIRKCFLRAAIKRSFDIVLSLALLALTAPLMLLAAMGIWIESRGKGPIFYSQRRVGLDNKCFNVHKFRSMKTDAEADGVARWAQEDDPRITRVGAFIRKYRIDELPQLWNVLVGEMSLVGPRPERPEFVQGLCQANPLYKERHRVCPGITGWAQLCYPYGASQDDSMSKLQYDLYYVKNHGLFLDVYTLIQTVEVVLFKKGSR